MLTEPQAMIVIDFSIGENNVCDGGVTSSLCIY